MEENITRLSWQEKEIILIATAHVSQQSVDLVRGTIRSEQPDSVCIELDQQRYDSIRNPGAWEKTDVVEVIRSKRVWFLIANMALSSYQKKIAKKLDTTVGGEMLQGMESAQDSGAKLVLADRNIQTTFLRIWRSLSGWEKIKLIFTLVFSVGEDQDISDEDLQEMLKGDMLDSVLADMRRQFPNIGRILVDERDQHLAAKIREAPGPKVVAVLGGAHVPGVAQEIFREQNLEEITRIPPAGVSGKVVGWIIPVIIVGLLLYSFYISAQTGLQQLLTWVVWNGGLAALFTLLALGHPLSILTALAVAPISSLNPFFACGWFAGLVEAWVRKPTVADVQSVSEDMFSIRGIFRNRFLKILLIVIMANLGSTIGTFVAGLDLVKNLI